MERRMADRLSPIPRSDTSTLRRVAAADPLQVQRRLIINTTEDCIAAQPRAPVWWSGPARSQPQASPSKGAAL